MYTGPHIIKDGLVFGYDTGYGIADNDTAARFYPGQPATNLVSAYNDNHVRSVTWTNSGTWVATYNASNRDKPVILGVDMSKCNLMHGETTTTGSQHFGCASVSVSASTTYTMSVYYLQNRAGASRPYFRTSVNNNNLGYLSYNGSTNTSNWPVNEWIRISVTVTVQSNENGCYLSNYIGSQVGDQVWYCAPMVAQTSQLTTFVDGTRSSTSSLIDLKETTDIDVSNMSFDSTGQPIFDGTDDFFTTSGLSTNESANLTFETVIRFNGALDSNDRKVFHWDKTDTSNGVAQIRKGTNNGRLMYQHHNGSQWYTLSVDNVVVADTFAHIVVVHNGTTATMYKNGTQIGTTSVGALNYTDAGEILLGYRSSAEYWKGDIPVFKMYTNALSASEIKQNFNAYKNRFDI